MDEQTFWAQTKRLAEIEANPNCTDELIDTAGDIASELILAPAPSPDALCWKIRFLFAVNDGVSTSAWDGQFIAQTLRDVDRFLGEHANV